MINYWSEINVSNNFQTDILEWSINCQNWYVMEESASPQYQLNTNPTYIRISDCNSLDGRLLAILVHGPHWCRGWGRHCSGDRSPVSLNINIRIFIVCLCLSCDNMFDWYHDMRTWCHGYYSTTHTLMANGWKQKLKWLIHTLIVHIDIVSQIILHFSVNYNWT